MAIPPIIPTETKIAHVFIIDGVKYILYKDGTWRKQNS